MNVFKQENETTNSTAISHQLDQQSLLEGNQFSAPSNTHTSPVNPKASHTERFVDTDQHAGAHTLQSNRTLWKSSEEEIIQATSTEKIEESQSAFDRETPLEISSASLETPMHSQPLDLNISIATPIESADINFTQAPLRNYYFAPFPAKLSGVAVSFEQGMTGGGFGGSFGESRAHRDAYRLQLSYRISRSLSIGIDYGKMTLIRRRLSYDAVSNVSDQTHVFVEKSSEMDFSTTHTDVMFSYIINPDDVLFFQLNGSIGTTLSGKAEPIFSLGPGIGYWINSYVAATLGMNYRGVFLSPQTAELPLINGNPVGIIKNTSGNSSLSSSVEIRFGFGFSLW